MAGADVKSIATALGVDPSALAVLERYDGEQVATVRRAVIEATVADSSGFDQAVERALKMIPWPIRGQARRILTGTRRA